MRKSDQRIIEENLLFEYGLLDGKTLYNPRTNRYIQATGQNIRRLYNELVEDIRELEPELPNIAEYTIYCDKKITGYDQLKEIFELYKGRKINVNWNSRDILYEVDNNFNKWFDDIYTDWMADSELSVFQEYWFNNGSRPPLTIEILSNVTPIQHPQRFSEGINHCLLNPILEWAEERMEEATTQTAKYRYKKIVKDVSKYIVEYKEGIPEEKIYDVCQELQIGIDISLPLVENKFISHRSFKKPLKIFKFSNTKFDHVDIIINTNKIINVETLDIMIKIKKDLDKRKEIYTYRKNKYIYSISTLKATFQLDNEYNNLINDFENKYNISSFKIDDVSQPKLSKFIKDGTHYNGTIDYNFNGLNYNCNKITKNGKPIKLIDMEKAYIQYKKSKYYNGFLGKITDFRRTNELMKINNVYVAGLYRIENIFFKNCDPSFKKIIKKLNCYKNGSVYTTPELLFLQDNNVKFKIVEGCWGINNIDIDLPKEFNELSPDNIKIYAKYTGQCDSHNLTSRFWMNGNKEMFENIKSYTENNISFIGNKACIEYKKEHNFHFGHFTSYITAYQRLNVFEQLLTIPYDNIIRLCVDGIYYTGEVELKNSFRHKYEFHLGNIAGNSYISGLTETYKLTSSNERPLYNIELHKGQGGTGKTHYNLTDKGNVKMLYIAPSWKLATNKKEEYKINSSVLARLTSKDPEMWRDYNKYYNVLIFDEVSQYSKEDVDIIINRYSNHKLIFCGDINYQLPCVLGTPLTTDIFKNQIEYTISHRFTDDKLKNLTLKIREDIDNKVYTRSLNEKILNYFKDNLKENIITKEELNNLYNIDDMILSSTHKNKDEFTELFKDKFEKEKFYITKNKNGYYNGSIIIDNKDFDKVDCEIRHAFTIHCIQGETAKNKLFIDMRRINNNQLIYTAISRARKLEQIYLII